MKRTSIDPRGRSRRQIRASVHRERVRHLHVLERALAQRETRVRARERLASSESLAVSKREEAIELRERALRARAEAARVRVERERLIGQLRDANERLVIATLRADELVDRAVAARALAAESATVEAERRLRAEQVAAQLLASEEALRASANEARATSRAKDEFIAMLGHELRNPLAPILMALDLIAMDTGDAHRREHAIIARQANMLVRLVDDLLDVARIRSGKIELRREPLDLADVVARAVETAAPLIEARRLTLSVDAAPGTLWVDGDAVRLTQCVGNLLTNAAKYTPPGGAVSVTGTRVGTNVVVQVRDTGIGISAKMLPRVFDRFAQEPQPADHPPGGLGLGLSIVRSLVRLHGGTVQASSGGLGRGSEFVIELPAIERGSVRIPEPTSRRDERSGMCRILVVDDNRTATEVTCRVLARLGHDVRAAFDGPSAYALVEHFIPDVVLMDIGLPGQDGYDVADRLRAALSSQAVHFIAVTGYGQEADRRRSAEAGFEDHLVKPVDTETLQRAIARVSQDSLPSSRG